MKSSVNGGVGARLARDVALLLATMALAFGVAVMAGWALGVRRVVYAGSSSVPMAFETALCVSLLALAAVARLQRRRMGAVVPAVAGLLVIAASLVDCVTRELTMIAVDGDAQMRPAAAGGLAAAALLALLPERCWRTAPTRWRRGVLTAFPFVMAMLSLGEAFTRPAPLSPGLLRLGLGAVASLLILGACFALLQLAAVRRERGPLQPWVSGIALGGTVLSFAGWFHLIQAQQALAEASDGTPAATLVLGLLLTFAAALAVRLAHDSATRARGLHDARQHLRQVSLEQDAAAARLAAVQRQLHETLEAMDEPFYLLDEGGCFVYVNRRAGELMQREPATLIGCRASEEFAHIVDTPLCQHIDGALRSACSFELEHWSVRLQRWFDVRGCPTAAGLVVMFRDVTQRVLDRQALDREREAAAEAGRALAVSERRFRSLFEHHPGIAVALDLDGLVREVNPAMQTVLGYEPQQLIGGSVADVFPGWDGLGERWHEPFAHGPVIELVARHAGGGKRRIAMTLVSTVDDGRVDGWFLLGHDVTAMHRSLRQLKVQAEVIDRTHDAVVVLDEAGCIVSWNRGATRLYGPRARDMLGRRFDELLGDTDRRALADELGRPDRSASEPAELEVRLQTPQGDAVVVLLSVSRIDAPEGGGALDLVYGLDITARRLAEDALRHSLMRAQSHSARLAGLGRATVEITRCLGRPELLQRIADDTRLLVGAHQCIVSVSPDGVLAEAVHAASFSSRYAERRDFDGKGLGAGVHGMVFQHGTAMRLTQQQLEQHPSRSSFGDLADGHPPLRGWLAAPMFGRDGRPIGLIQLSDRYEGDFDDDDLAVAVQLAQTAAVAVECDALYARSQAADRERRREVRLSRAVADRLRKALFVFEANGRLAFANRSARQLSGASSRRELAQLRLGDTPMRDAVQGVLACGEPASGIVHTGDDRHFDYLIVPLTVGGRREGAVAMLRELPADGTAVAERLSASTAVALAFERPEAAPATPPVPSPALLDDSSDPVTRLPRRARLIAGIGAMLARGGRHAVAVLHVDVDQFKEINDTFGHDFGDEVLREVSRRIGECLREGDLLGRLVGDEFIVLLSGLPDPNAATGVIERILCAVAQPLMLHGETFFVTCSIGVATASGEEAADPASLMRQAEAATGEAKAAGRNTFHMFTTDLTQRASERLQLRTRLQAAITRQEFTLHYQPQVELASGRISGIEALVRWNHPTLGQVGPMRFIPVAEDTGQIVPIGEWVMEQACRQHCEWLARGLVDCTIAVNVSSVQFRRPNFVEKVQDILQRTQLSPDRLELELTESVMMDSTGRASETLQRLRGLGVRVSIDDFGTGFSSLAYLKRFPIDKVKIDRSFVADITHDSDDASITLSVIAIAHHLKMKVIAEGVETAAQVNYLRRHFCDEVQGFLISAPLPGAELEAFLCGYDPGAELAGAAPVQRPTLLLVDDEPNVLRALCRVLRRDGYQILSAADANQALEVLATHPVHVVLSDQRMAAMCGTEFLSEVKSLYPDTVRLVLSGYTDLQSVTEAINRGAIYRFLTKPWEDEPLRAHIKDAFMHHRRHLRAKAA
jgi:diguanylate cyclase (GGDEF)-like protein/PAS domain S-box-containing protein